MPTAAAVPPQSSRPVISSSIDLNLASSATLESLGVLFLPLASRAVAMVWVSSANNFPFLFFWWRKRQKEELTAIA